MSDPIQPRDPKEPDRRGPPPGRTGPPMPRRAACRARRAPTPPGPDGARDRHARGRPGQRGALALHRLRRPRDGRHGVHRARVPPREPRGEHRVPGAAPAGLLATGRRPWPASPATCTTWATRSPVTRTGRPARSSCTKSLRDSVHGADLMPDRRGDREPRGDRGHGRLAHLGGGDPGRQVATCTAAACASRADRVRHPRPGELRRRAIVPAGRLRTPARSAWS